MFTHDQMRSYINCYLADRGIPEISSIRLSREIKGYFRQWDKNSGKLLEKNKPNVFGFYLETLRNVRYCIVKDPEAFIIENPEVVIAPVPKQPSKNQVNLWEMQKAVKGEEQ